MISSHFVSDYRHAFIDLAGPLQFDQPDPVYPYTPPTIEESIKELSERPPPSFDSLTLSVPSRPRSASTVKAVNALAQFLSSPACLDLSTLRIAGSLVLLNDKDVQDSLKHLKLRTLILQEPKALADSYALAAILAAVDGITELHIASDTEDGKNLHDTFQQETVHTFKKLKSLSLSTKGNVRTTISAVFGLGSLAGLETLNICFQGTTWSPDATHALINASNGFPVLHTVNIARLASDHRMTIRCDGNALLPLITLRSLQHVNLEAGNPTEGFELSADTIYALSSSIQSLELVHAGPSHVVNLYTALQNTLPNFDKLEKVQFTHSYPEERLRNDTDDWELIRVHATHPAAARKNASNVMSSLADALEAANISYRLQLLGAEHHEERASLSRSSER